MKTKKRKPTPKRTASRKPRTARRSQAAPPGKKEFARVIWPAIRASTRFTELRETQSFVILRDGSTAALAWYSVSHGPRIFGYYDDKSNVCYIGKYMA
jgi:hypothetical protein